jgi:hypothetical protein
MQTRILHTEIWQDDFFSELNPQEKLLFIYFLTNERVNIIHLYQCSVARVHADTGINTPIIVEAQRKFEKQGKIFFFENYIYLKNASKYENYTGMLNDRAKLKLFARLSQSVLDWYNKLSDTPIHTPIIIPIRNKKSEIRNNKKEIRHIRREDITTENIDPDDIPI